METKEKVQFFGTLQELAGLVVQFPSRFHTILTSEIITDKVFWEGF